MSAPTDLTKRLFSVEGAAAYLSISKRSMTALLAKGEVLKIRIGNRTLVDKADLDAYVERLKKSA